MKADGMPDAMLLDFGGVLVDVINRPDGLHKIALEVYDLLQQSHIVSVRLDRVERDLNAGWKGYSGWKSGEGRRPRPREIGHREFWEEFVATDWPEPARATVVAHASALCERLDFATKDRPPKADSLETLRALSSVGIRIAVVSNALCGAGTRGLARQYGFEPYLTAQIYSDEAGIRKPNPDVFVRAATALTTNVTRCWYVGDQLDRDVLGGRRAGVGRVILLPSGETGMGNDAIVEPDDVIQKPSDLLRLLPTQIRV